jgi:hypothetical protein
MNASKLKLAACALWAVAAIAQSVPSADAYAWSRSNGAYATCANTWLSNSFVFCDMSIGTPYRQQIKMISTACNSGACASDPTESYVDSVYAVGRKTAVVQESCVQENGVTWKKYGLSTCAC